MILKMHKLEVRMQKMNILVIVANSFHCKSEKMPIILKTRREERYLFLKECGLFWQYKDMEDFTQICFSKILKPHFLM